MLVCFLVLLVLLAPVAAWRSPSTFAKSAVATRNASPRCCALPPCFLSADAFAAAVSEDKCTQKLLQYAPAAFRGLPPESVVAEDVVLRGDLGQELARGREAYLSAFSTVASLNDSPLVPLRA